MMPELGHFALCIALALAFVQALSGLTGAWQRRQRWMDVAHSAVAGQAVFVGLAFVLLARAFLQNDFSVLYVANNSNSALPTLFRLSAVWGAHEGSLLLWAFILSLWSLAVSLFSKSLPESFRARVVGILGLVSVGFLSFTLGTSNPFTRLLPAAADGADASSSPPSGEAALIEAMRERLLGCPVLRNLDPAINRSLRIAITP